MDYLHVTNIITQSMTRTHSQTSEQSLTLSCLITYLLFHTKSCCFYVGFFLIHSPLSNRFATSFLALSPSYLDYHSLGCLPTITAPDFH